MKPSLKNNQKINPESENLVLYEEKNYVATLTLNRPKKFNALSEEMLKILQNILDDIAAKNFLKIVIIQGAGKSFCAGHDLKEMINKREEIYYKNLFLKCSKMMMTINKIPQPVIAKVHGIATAAGCQLVAACDLAVASTESRFATSGINIGLFCSTPAVPISRNVSRKKALEFLLTGEFIDSETALSWGLINRISSPENLENEVNKLVNVILSKPRIAVSIGKKMFYKQLELNMEDAYAYASRTMACNMMENDVADRVKSFLKKK